MLTQYCAVTSGFLQELNDSSPGAQLVSPEALHCNTSKIVRVPGISLHRCLGYDEMWRLSGCDTCLRKKSRWVRAPVVASGFPCSLPLCPLPPTPSCFDKVEYHCRELPQVSFLWRQTNCGHKHVFVETKHVFCRDKGILVATKPLSRPKYFVGTNIILSRQAYFYRDKNDICGSSRQ